MKSDSDIKRDVDDELRWDPNVHAQDIAIAVTDGVVALTGFVPSYAAKSAAEKAAQRVAGAVGVADDLEVRLPGIDQRPDPTSPATPSGSSRSGCPTAGRISKRSSTTPG